MEAASLIHTLVHHLSALYNRESDQVLQEQLGIGFAQYKILSTLSENPAAQQKHIAFALGQTEASISRQVKLLQEKALLEVHVNPQNRREHLTKLTTRGQRLTDSAQQILLNFQLNSLAHLSVKDQAKLLELLSKVPSPTRP